MNSNGIGHWNPSMASAGNLIDSLAGLGQSGGPVLKDRLLTDSLVNQMAAKTIGGGLNSGLNGLNSLSGLGGLNEANGQNGGHYSEEHSYSLGGSISSANSSTFGSDGDSMPESPLSLDDGKPIMRYY